MDSDSDSEESKSLKLMKKSFWKVKVKRQELFMSQILMIGLKLQKNKVGHKYDNLN